jgi:hypothetical protein
LLHKTTSIKEERNERKTNHEKENVRGEGERRRTKEIREEGGLPDEGGDADGEGGAGGVRWLVAGGCKV